MKIAIIFASGIGKRLQPLTNDIHKSLIKIAELPLIEHLINNLSQVSTLKKIIIVTGYHHDDFLYLTKKYQYVTLVYNANYLPYESAHALTLVKDYFNKTNDIFIIAGDFVMKENCFLNPINKNVMAAMKRKVPNHKADWSYQLNQAGNITNIIKTNDANSLLASEWTHINRTWAQLIGTELNNQTIQKTLKDTIVGKFLINHSIKYNIELKPYILDYDKFWDLDTPEDLQRVQNFISNK